MVNTSFLLGEGAGFFYYVSTVSVSRSHTYHTTRVYINVRALKRPRGVLCGKRAVRNREK